MPDHTEHFPGRFHHPPLASNVDAIQPGEHVEHPHHPKLQHHFDDMEQQIEASSLGMWVFIAQEIMFFGGMFAAYMVYRLWYYDGFVAASRELDLVLGGINTVVLIGSSLTVALAVHAAQTGRQKQIVNYLLLTGVLQPLPTA